MKEQTLLEIKNQVEATKRVLQHIINELSHLRELGVGTLETIKLMPGYQDAIDELKKQLEENVEQKKSIESNGVSK